MPLASEISTGAMAPRKTDGMNDDINEMRAVKSYSFGNFLRNYKKYIDISQNTTEWDQRWNGLPGQFGGRWSAHTPDFQTGLRELAHCRRQSPIPDIPELLKNLARSAIFEN